ncbi:MAG: hypothetical protein ACRDRJ_11795, partial [Streptosporangiaceae bacterium]
PLNVAVTTPPGFFAKYLWLIVGIVALIALIVGAVFLARARRRYNKDVRPLRVQVSHDGGAWSTEHRPLGDWADTFNFVVRDEDNEYARPELPDPAHPAPPYTARRVGRGQVRLSTPDGREHDVTLGSAGVQLDKGLRVTFRDIRRREAPVPPSIGPTTPPPPAAPPPQPAPPPNGQATSVPPVPPAPQTPPVQVPPEQAGGWDDPWLN